MLLSIVSVCIAQPGEFHQGRDEAGFARGKHQEGHSRGPEAGGKELESFIRENFPDDADELISWLEILRDHKPMEYGMKVRELGKKLRVLNMLKDKAPDKYETCIKAIKLEIRSSKLGKEYGEAETEKEKTKIKNKLQKVLNEIFETKQAENEDRIEKVEEKLSDLKERHSARRENKEQIVNARLEQIIASVSGLAW